MTQQTQFKKLKEQIRAAKRDLTEMSDPEVGVGPAHSFSSYASSEIVDSKQIETKLGSLPSNDAINTSVVDVSSKAARSDTSTTEHNPSNSGKALADEFKFFHREKQPKNRANLVAGIPPEEAKNVEFEAFLSERFGRRLAILESDLEQNRKYIRELIALLSQLDLRQNPVNRKLKPSQRLNRLYFFWLVIGFLAVGWFGLTPSGHLAFKHFLTFL